MHPRSARPTRPATRFAVFGAALAIGLTVGVAPASASTATDPGRCAPVEYPVRIGPLHQVVRGTLCEPRSRPADTIMLLVPGATYSQVYWDFPYQPEQYNFRRAMNEGGLATLTIDRLGAGTSSRPPSAVVTAHAQADAVHQVITAIRAGAPGRRVLLGGHSLGSMISYIEASTYRDVDGLLITGILHRLDPVDFGLLFTRMQPATLDPKFRGELIDPGYLTTQPGVRREAFSRPGAAEPEVARIDEEARDVFSTAEAPDGVAFGVFLAARADAIDVPVMIAIGAQEPYLCGPLATDCTSPDTVAAAERPYYPAAPTLDVHLVPGWGHDINLAPVAPGYHDAVVDWTRRTHRAS